MNLDNISQDVDMSVCRGNMFIKPKRLRPLFGLAFTKILDYPIMIMILIAIGILKITCILVDGHISVQFQEDGFREEYTWNL